MCSTSSHGLSNGCILRSPSEIDDLSVVYSVLLAVRWTLLLRDYRRPDLVHFRAAVRCNAFAWSD
jgi:hypothetical protein